MSSIVINIPTAASYLVVGGDLDRHRPDCRGRAHELRPERMAQKNIARKQELDAQIELAKAHRQCVTCGQKYEPELT